MAEPQQRMNQHRRLPNHQNRPTIAVVVCAEINPVEASQVAEVFMHANEEGCAYDLVPVAFTPGIDALPQRCHCVVVPPLHRWIGLGGSSPMVQWMGSLVSSAEHTIGVGTGNFLLAATGALDDHDIVADHGYAAELAAVAPAARVHVGVSALRDGALSTSIAGTAAIMLCSSLVGDHYGIDVQHRLMARLVPHVGAHRPTYQVRRSGV
jgi:transcriptional regulator GlxA family with amidase domain